MASSAEATETSKPSTETTTKGAKIITLKISDEAIFEVEDSVAMEILVMVKSFLKDQSPSTELFLSRMYWPTHSHTFIEFCKEHIMLKACSTCLARLLLIGFRFKSVEYMRKFFGIENDFTPEEEGKCYVKNILGRVEDVDEDYLKFGSFRG
ncbi:hypothetical protein POTOM_060023 [Populus tomentosa]|uniref:SKP1 component dimerisation domain-containing protein n=1 Tax=Populus tomentosa TaxID=118781 RepID=A0A8X7XNQ4_POPTO|nr:hypothetical protein POTOM_060023 [Populus tomentosa]